MRRRRSRTREEYVESLRWNVRDTSEALKNAVDMRRWEGVIKYAKQLQVLERKLFVAENAPSRSSRIQDEMRKEYFRRADTETETQRANRLRRAGWSVSTKRDRSRR